MKKLLWIILLQALYVGLQSSYAQQVGEKITYYVIETVDGNEFTGQLVYQDEEQVRIKPEKMSEITLRRVDVRSIREMEGRLMPDGSLWGENLQATRYFWAPNGYGLKAGEGYYQNVWVLWNQASVGVTDNFSIGLGMIPLFFFAGTSTPVWITPKVSIPLVDERINIGAGALAGTVFGEENSGFGIVYGVSTFGSRDRNVSLGLGYGYAAGDWATAPLINLSGMFRISKNGYLLTENYFIGVEGDNLGVLSVGGRAMIKKFGLDFGGFIPVSDFIDEFVVLPWLGFSVPFGKVTN